ncbi:MAG: hypothetical protein Q8P18_21165 [Pseudomonadota bacterium]|nr:hypothetical protein [Pseudomonadota bacterium]
MLAGRMKLNTFIAMLAVGGGCGLAGFAFATYTMSPDSPPQAAPTPVVLMPAPAPPPTAPIEAVLDAPVASPPVGAPDLGGAREIDRMVIGYVGRDIGTDKLKDVSQGKPWKVNVYQDKGSATANRAKVDLDRDDKWDEKFTFKGGAITRDVAPADDEAYTLSYRWDGKDWVSGG